MSTSTLNCKQALESLGHEVFVIAPRCEGYEDHDDHIIRLPSAKNYVFDKREMAVIYPGLAKKLDKYKFVSKGKSLKYWRSANKFLKKKPAGSSMKPS